MNIIIGADIVPTNNNCSCFNKGDVEALIGKELEKKLFDADYRIYNLEVPLADISDPIKKCGPNLIAPCSTIKGIQALNPDLLTLANNHIMDQGEQGLYSTIELLNRSGIAYIGAGKNLSEAEKPYIIQKEGMHIGIYACAEHEFSIAEENKAGANPYDALYSFDHISELKKICDYVIVLYHGMKEFYRLPTPKLQKTLRRMIDKGADLVICQHNHCVGCEEDYQKGKIIYGQGNFIFDYGDDEFWNSSLLISIDITKEKIEFEYIPIVKNGAVVRIAEKKEGDKIINNYWERSKKASDSNYIKKQYQIEAERNLSDKLRLLSGWFGTNRLFRIVNKLFGGKLIYIFYSKKHLIVVKNMIECEVHHEILLQGINDKIMSDSKEG